MDTLEHLGKNNLLDRLANQVGNIELAKSLLIKRGHMNVDGTLTNAGIQRNNMSAEERAIDRASKRSGKPDWNYSYDFNTNKAIYNKFGDH